MGGGGADDKQLSYVIIFSVNKIICSEFKNKTSLM